MATVPTKVSFLGIGAQKCATTWLHQALQAHPELNLPQQKEINFFSYHYDQGSYWYHQQFEALPLIRGEISPSYLPDHRAPERAYKYNPNLKIILMLRDPIDRAFSHHLHLIRTQVLTGEQTIFEKGLAANPMYIEQSLYAKHLKNWLNYFPKEQIYWIFQEDLKTNHQDKYQALCQFLGINQHIHNSMVDQTVHSSSVSQYPTLEKNLKNAGKFARKIGLSKLVQQTKSQAIVQQFMNEHKQHISETIPPIQNATQKVLLESFSDDMQNLCQLLEITDLPWSSWKATQ